nr:MAG TPA: hypothetical protein [Caudoviricetes sp.]
MSKVKDAVKLLLVLFSPVMLVIAARAMRTICMRVLAGIVPTARSLVFCPAASNSIVYSCWMLRFL